MLFLVWHSVYRIIWNGNHYSAAVIGSMFTGSYDCSSNPDTGRHWRFGADYDDVDRRGGRRGYGWRDNAYLPLCDFCISIYCRWSVYSADKEWKKITSVLIKIASMLMLFL